MDANVRPVLAHQFREVAGPCDRQPFIWEKIIGKGAPHRHRNDGQAPVVAVRVEEYIDIGEVGREGFRIAPPVMQRVQLLRRRLRCPCNAVYQKNLVLNGALDLASPPRQVADDDARDQALQRRSTRVGSKALRPCTALPITTFSTSACMTVRRRWSSSPGHRSRSFSSSRPSRP